MSRSKEKRGPLARLRRWIRGIAPDVDPEMSACEFECRELDCAEGRWESCARRRAHAASARAHAEERVAHGQ